MKRYVQEAANDCLRELKRLEQFALDVAKHYGYLDTAKKAEIKKEYDQKRERISCLLSQCEYGYISDLEAVKQIASV